MSFRLVPKSVTLNDLERRNNYSQVAAVHPFGLSWAITISGLHFIVWQPSNDAYRWLFISKCVFYVLSESSKHRSTLRCWYFDRRLFCLSQSTRLTDGRTDGRTNERTDRQKVDSICAL